MCFQVSCEKENFQTEQQFSSPTCAKKKCKEPVIQAAQTYSEYKKSPDKLDSSSDSSSMPNLLCPDDVVARGRYG
jgi:hypothetical protein